MVKPVAQYFIKDGQRIPFSQFLISEKEKRQCNWKNLSEKCGVNKIEAYVMANTKGEPNRPPSDKFLTIIHALGYSENDFEISLKITRGRGTNKYPSRTYQENLILLGEGLLKENQEYTEKGLRLQMISSTSIKRYCTPTFYATYANTYPKREKLYRNLIALNPKFDVIKLQHQTQNRTSIRPLEPFENEFITNYLLEHIDYIDERAYERLPHEALLFVFDTINKERKSRNLSDRTLESVRWHVYRLRKNYHKPDMPKRGSPASRAEITKIILKKRIENLDKKQKKVARKALKPEILVEKDPENHRRNTFFKYASEAHDNLVLFLTEPNNYHAYISKDIELFTVDFNEKAVDEVVKVKFKEKIELVKIRHIESPDEAEVTDFVEQWLRCDIIFTRQGGGFVVVEVKPNATNKKNGYDNGTKACQQLAAYAAVILDNITRYNIDHINTVNYIPIKEHIEGCLIAYDIDKVVFNHLNRASNKRPIIIPKEKVDEYIVQLHG
jgi:hypothetical protein